MPEPYEVACTTLAADLRALDGDHKSSAADLAEGLIKLGWTKAQYVIRYPNDYYVGRRVEVLDSGKGRWLEGDVSGGVGGTIQVDTEFGPRTVGSPRNIRPVW